MTEFIPINQLAYTEVFVRTVINHAKLSFDKLVETGMCNDDGHFNPYKLYTLIKEFNNSRNQYFDDTPKLTSKRHVFFKPNELERRDEFRYLYKVSRLPENWEDILDGKATFDEAKYYEKPKPVQAVKSKGKKPKEKYKTFSIFD